jgi:hypothetical protein
VETLDDLKKEFISYGGSPELLKDFKDLKTAKSLTEIQKKVFDLKQGSNVNVKDSNSIKESFRQLEELRARDLSTLDTDSDEYRVHQNRIIELENKIRLQLNLKTKPFLILDETLGNVISLGNDSVQEYLSELPKNIKSDSVDRINQIVQVRKREKEIEQEHVNFVLSVSEKLQSLSGFKPEQYNIKNDKLIPNKSYIRWKADLFDLKRNLDRKIRLEKSLEENEVNGFKVDKRGSIYKLSEKVDALIKKHDLKE